MNRIFHNTKWALINKILQVFFQTITFLLLVKLLSLEEFGIYATVTALCLILMNFVNPGITNIITRNIAQLKDIRNTLTFSFRITWLYSLFFTIISSVLLTLVFSEKYFIYFFILTLNEFLVNRYFEIIYAYYQGEEKIKKFSFIQTINIILKFLIVFILLLLDTSSNDIFIIFIISSFIANSIYFFMIFKNFNFTFSKYYSFQMRENFKIGMHFAISTASKNLSSNTDKIMISKMLSFDTTAYYTLSYRIIQLTMIPMQALFISMYTPYFKNGLHGIKNNLLLLIKVIKFPLIYILVVGILIFNFSFLVPDIFGDKYKDSIDLIKIFVFLPIFLTLNSLLADAITGAGYQKERTFFQLLSAILNIFLNILLINKCGVFGALYATFISEIFLLISLIILASIKYRKETHKMENT